MQPQLVRLGLFKVICLNRFPNIGPQLFPRICFRHDILAKGLSHESAVGILRNFKDEFAHTDTIR